MTWSLSSWLNRSSSSIFSDWQPFIGAQTCLAVNCTCCICRWLHGSCRPVNIGSNEVTLVQALFSIFFDPSSSIALMARMMEPVTSDWRESPRVAPPQRNTPAPRCGDRRLTDVIPKI